MQQTNKQRGYASELLVSEFYQNTGHTIIKKNYTIPGGEIDLVVEKDSMMIFVEVKDVSSRDDISDYVTSKKIVTLRKAIDMYIWSMTYEGNYRLDIVFVSRGRIIEQFCDVIIDS